MRSVKFILLIVLLFCPGFIGAEQSDSESGVISWRGRTFSTNRYERSKPDFKTRYFDRKWRTDLTGGKKSKLRSWRDRKFRTRYYERSKVGFKTRGFDRRWKTKYYRKGNNFYDRNWRRSKTKY
jgi:hypothetical protein